MFSVVGQLFKFMRVYRKFWLAPIIFGLLGLGHGQRDLVLSQVAAQRPEAQEEKAPGHEQREADAPHMATADQEHARGQQVGPEGDLGQLEALVRFLY